MMIHPISEKDPKSQSPKAEISEFTADPRRFDCIKLIWGDAWNDLVDNDHDGKLIEA